MDETSEKVLSDKNDCKVPESPKPLAFTIDFGERKSVDTQRYKNLVEKYQNRHRRGQSLSKFEEATSAPVTKKHPLTGNLPRKSSFHSEGYFSSDEKVDRFKHHGIKSSVLNTVISKGDLSLPLRNLTSDRVSSHHVSNRNFDLPSINSPEIELKDVSSPELELISPISPLTNNTKSNENSSPECDVSGSTARPQDYPADCEKSDTISDAGTYTLDADNYTEEQKARMSIDKYFNIEQVSVIKKTQEYIESLSLDNKSNLSQNTVQAGTLQQANSPPTSTKITKKIFNKILYPRVNYQNADKSETNDTGVFTSITASGVLSKRSERFTHTRRRSLAQSEIFVEAYTGEAKPTFESTRLVQANIAAATKIPSPVHASRPRSQTSWGSQNLDLSDSSLETESYLKPTQNIISSLQARLSIESDPDSDLDKKYIALNNETRKLLKDKTMHVRHNSFDDRNIKIANKLEHFHNKNLQGIDQTLKTLNQYSKPLHRIHNSPNNSPIRRSSSFSLKNQLDSQPKCLNKDVNLASNSPSLQRNGSVQRSASTASIKSGIDAMAIRRSSVTSDKTKSAYLDSESSSDEEEFEVQNKKDIVNTRYNRAFSLRRARLEPEVTQQPRCPNTPELRRKFAPVERTVSVDRKSARAIDVPSRYMNITKPRPTPPKPEPPKAPPKPTTKQSGKPPVFARTDTGRFSMRTTRPATAAPKPTRRDTQAKKQSGPRSNSTLSSREVEFQNWKRRKSYDPMKAAAEGKRKAELARKQTQNIMTQSYNESNSQQECDSSPSHSSSVHRSQSFHGTAALEQLVSSEDEDLTLSGDEDGFSPPTPSPCQLSPAKSNLRQIWMDKFTSKR